MTQQLNPDDAPDGYVAVEGDGCDGCAFCLNPLVSCRGTDNEPDQYCSGAERSDKTEVIFVKRTPAPVEKAAPVATDRESVRRELMAMARCDAITDRHRVVIGAAIGHLGSAQQAAQPVAPIKQGLTPDTQPVAGEPVWYAVTSKQAPIIDKAIRRLDVAQEYADKCSETYPGVEVIPLYTAAPAPAGLVPLTDDQIDEEWFDVHTLPVNNVAKARLFARAIEAAHGIKAGKDGEK